MFALESVVPWGRSFDEYRRMFALDEHDLADRIVGCADGPASFNAEATRRGIDVVSCDPIYRYDADQIKGRIAATCQEVLAQTRKNASEFVWDVVGSVEQLGQMRMAAMNDFLADYPSGLATGRYVEAELPRLPFDDLSFGLALSSHFLFLYTIHLGEEFHRLAIQEMCRVAREARIFPLLTLDAKPSPLVEPVSSYLRQVGLEVSIETVPYEFQRGGNQMMRVRRVGNGAPDAAANSRERPAVK